MRFDVRPKSNQLTAIGNSTHGFAEVHSRGVEAALAASTHAGHKEAEEERSNKLSQSVPCAEIAQSKHPGLRFR